MERNSFYCPDCKERTVHFEISPDEAAAMQGRNAGMQALGRVGQYTGIFAFVKMITGFKLWKCSKCGLGTSRKPSGIIEAQFKDGKWRD